MRKAAATISLVAAVSLLVSGVWWYCLKEWGAWHDFAASFVQQDGRVIDFAAGNRSTSEGQAYAMFFALVANDRNNFENLLGWTQDNLAQGNLAANLPAWLWGQKDSGEWGVIDSNPASDSDLWITYSLLEAGRLWQRQDYTDLANAMLLQIKNREVETIPRWGPVLLPAPFGFRTEEDGWRLNPSYVPEFILKSFAQADPQGPWTQMIPANQALLAQAAPQGLVPDWFVVTASGEVVEDPETGPLGSYEAIRVYLWEGLGAGQASGLKRVAASSMAELVKKTGFVPERIDTRTGETENEAPIGFYGALLPYIEMLDDDELLATLSVKLRDRAADDDPRNDYYERVLTLFGSGWFEDYYRIDEHGRTSPRWSRNCCGILH